MRPFLCSEFLDFVSSRFGPLDLGAIPGCEPTACDGHGHVRALADDAAGRTRVPAPALLSGFGAFLFGRLVRRYPSFFVGIESTLDLVTRFESDFATEVRKLDPEARLGSLAIDTVGRPRIEVEYRSPDGLADIAHGLLSGSIAYFAEPLALERNDEPETAGRQARFTLRPRDLARTPTAGAA